MLNFALFLHRMVNGFLNANQIHESGLPIVNGVLNVNQIRESGFLEQFELISCVL